MNKLFKNKEKVAYVGLISSLVPFISIVAIMSGIPRHIRIPSQIYSILIILLPLLCVLSLIIGNTSMKSDDKKIKFLGSISVLAGAVSFIVCLWVVLFVLALSHA